MGICPFVTDVASNARTDNRAHRSPNHRARNSARSRAYRCSLLLAGQRLRRLSLG